MSLAKRFFSQTRKPEGFLGKMMLSTMNPGHAKLADWGFTHLPAIAPESAVDLGCGFFRSHERSSSVQAVDHGTGEEIRNHAFNGISCNRILRCDGFDADILRGLYSG